MARQQVQVVACDRCDVVMRYPKGEFPTTWTFVTRSALGSDEGTLSDLCPSCTDEFMRFMKGR